MLYWYQKEVVTHKGQTKMTHSRVARMGTSTSKYGQQRNEFERGDAVVVRGLNNEITDSGIVHRATTQTVIIVRENGQQAAYTPRFVEVTG